MFTGKQTSLFLFRFCIPLFVAEKFIYIGLYQEQRGIKRLQFKLYRCKREMEG